MIIERNTIMHAEYAEMSELYSLPFIETGFSNYCKNQQFLVSKVRIAACGIICLTKEDKIGPN